MNQESSKWNRAYAILFSFTKQLACFLQWLLAVTLGILLLSPTISPKNVGWKSCGEKGVRKKTIPISFEVRKMKVWKIKPAVSAGPLIGWYLGPNGAPVSKKPELLSEEGMLPAWAEIHALQTEHRRDNGLHKLNPIYYSLMPNLQPWILENY